MTSKSEDYLDGRVSDKASIDPEVPLDQRIRKLVEEPVAVLCTQGEGQPYGSLVFFAFSNDLRFSVTGPWLMHSRAGLKP